MRAVNSLRWRLTIAFASVALVPLALAMLIVSQRIQVSVRTEADDRLSSALAGLGAQMSSTGQRLGEQLAALGSDGQLKRLYLVPTGEVAELRQYLADQRFMLGLDYLWLTDTSGNVVADAALAASARSTAGAEPIAGGALAASSSPGVGVGQVNGAAGLTLDAQSEITYRGVRAGSMRGGVRLDSTLLQRLGQASGVELVLSDAAGRLVASTRAVRGEQPGVHERTERVVLDGASFLARTAPLSVGAEPRARITALFPTTAADRTLAAFRNAALLLGGLGLLLALALGALWSRQIARPVERLAAFSQRVARGDWDEPLVLEGVRELQTLIDALERMRQDLLADRDRLRASERHAAYGQMARQVAHEINNPLTPIAISVADLGRAYANQAPGFGEILEQAVRTVGEEVQRLKRLLADFNELGRFPTPRPAHFEAAQLATDVADLYRVEVAEGRLNVSASGTAKLMADHDQLRQALFNLTQNALDATAAGGSVKFELRPHGGTLEISVSDDGPGLTSEQRSQIFVPGFTTKPRGNGIGLTLVERIVTDHLGTLTVESAPGHGTTFVMRLPLTPEA
jgi:nitrogen fixation/metabolism regulation signal transduction histidine kinase